MSVKGKSRCAVPITGGAQGICKGIAQSLSNAGDRVFIADNDRQALQKTVAGLAGQISPGQVDVSDESSVVAMEAFLISPGASFITGQNFVVDGGMTREIIYAP